MDQDFWGHTENASFALSQHKEKTPRDPTIAAKFNTYRLADYKESMIALLGRVSVYSVAITAAARAVVRAE